MRLSDFTGRHNSLEEGQEHSDLGRQLREELYQSIPSQRIAQLALLERKRARRELAALIEQVLNAMSLDLDASQRRDLVAEVTDMVLGLGPLEPLLANENVTEVMVVGPDKVFFEEGGVIYPARESFQSEAQLRQVVDRIVSPLGRRIDEQSPIVNARLPEGHRVNAVIPPISLCGTVLTIRKFKTTALSLDDLVSLGGMSQEIAQLLAWAVKKRMNIAVSGGTGGGKTTLLNALSMEIPSQERIITIEDSAELRFDAHPHVVRLEARSANAEGSGQVTIRDLVINALRMRPDRIVVGECRGEEALDMLQAMCTGHDGSLTTLHANSPAEVVSRLVMMVRFGMELPAQIVQEQVVSALDLIVQQDRISGGQRRITQIAVRASELEAGAVPGFYVAAVRWDKKEGAYRWTHEPAFVNQLCLDGIATEQEVGKWRQGVQLCS